jgi:hypothetical protein
MSRKPSTILALVVFCVVVPLSLGVVIYVLTSGTLVLLRDIFPPLFNWVTHDDALLLGAAVFGLWGLSLLALDKWFGLLDRLEHFLEKDEEE